MSTRKNPENGRFPFATLHLAKTDPDMAAKLQVRWTGLYRVAAREYVRRCLVTDGYPHMIDQFEDDEHYKEEV